MKIDDYIKKCLNMDFPFTHLTQDSIVRNYRTLCLKDLSYSSVCCMQLIQHFHPSIWMCSKKYKLSPYSAWHNEKILRKVIENRLKYKNKTDILSPKDIRQGFSTSGIAPKISLFKPALAKYLIQKYLNEFNEIFDPCCGYSGRLLGACSLNKQYIGQDINFTTVKECNNLVNNLHLSAKISCKNSLSSKGNYESLLTCPPYEDKENWNQDIEILTCDEWIDVILNNFDCKRYIFVVDKTEKYKKYVVEELKHNSHLSESRELVILIDRK